MKVTSIKVGPLKCNCYILEKENFCIVIDPGDEYNKIKRQLEGKEVISILITHNHFDHVGCLEQLKEEYHCPVYQKENLKEGPFKIGTFSFEVIPTPGHSPDSISFYFKEEKIMFTGDFLFYHTIGRCDLEGSNEIEMLNSIHKIKQYEDDIIVYPGHGDFTTLGREKKDNPYF